MISRRMWESGCEMRHERALIIIVVSCFRNGRQLFFLAVLSNGEGFWCETSPPLFALYLMYFVSL
jgi:hypothetical protein